MKFWTSALRRRNGAAGLGLCLALFLTTHHKVHGQFAVTNGLTHIHHSRWISQGQLKLINQSEDTLHLMLKTDSLVGDWNNLIIPSEAVLPPRSEMNLTYTWPSADSSLIGTSVDIEPISSFGSRTVEGIEIQHALRYRVAIYRGPIRLANHPAHQMIQANDTLSVMNGTDGMLLAAIHWRDRQGVSTLQEDMKLILPGASVEFPIPSPRPFAAWLIDHLERAAALKLRP